MRRDLENKLRRRFNMLLSAEALRAESGLGFDRVESSVHPHGVGIKPSPAR